MEQFLLAALSLLVVAAIYVRWRLYAPRQHWSVTVLFIGVGIGSAVTMVVPAAYFELAFGTLLLLIALTAIGIFVRPA